MEKNLKKRYEKITLSFNKVYVFLDICYNDKKKKWDYTFNIDEIWSIMLSEDMLGHLIKLRKFNQIK